MRLIEFFKISLIRLIEFSFYTVGGIEFYRNYSRFYFKNLPKKNVIVIEKINPKEKAEYIFETIDNELTYLESKQKVKKISLFLVSQVIQHCDKESVNFWGAVAENIEKQNK